MQTATPRLQGVGWAVHGVGSRGVGHAGWARRARPSGCARSVLQGARAWVRLDALHQNHHTGQCKLTTLLASRAVDCAAVPCLPVWARARACVRACTFACVCVREWVRVALHPYVMDVSERWDRRRFPPCSDHCQNCPAPLAASTGTFRTPFLHFTGTASCPPPPPMRESFDKWCGYRLRGRTITQPTSITREHGRYGRHCRAPGLAGA